MNTSEKLFAARILYAALSILLIALVILFYKEYAPDLMIQAEQFVAASMGEINTTVASR
jgi:hypothetical protein